MGLFDMFKKKPSATLATVFETHVGRSLETLHEMNETFRSQTVTDLEPTDGTLTLDGTPLTFQYLGAIGKVDGRWQWADDEDLEFVPARSLVASKRVLALGKTLGIRELERYGGPIHVDVATLIAMGVGELTGRVSIRNDECAFWFGLESGAVPPVPRPDAMKMSRIMLAAMRVLDVLPFDPIAAFRHYATSYGMKLREVPGGVEADVAPNQTCGAVLSSPESELERVLGAGTVGYSFPVSMNDRARSARD